MKKRMKTINLVVCNLEGGHNSCHHCYNGFCGGSDKCFYKGKALELPIVDKEEK